MDISSWLLLTCSMASTIFAMPLVFDDAHGINGRFVPGVTSLTDCLRWCASNPGQCYGFDWDHVLVRCFSHDISTECLPLRSRRNIVHYRFTQCEPAATTRAPTTPAAGQPGNQVPSGNGGASSPGGEVIFPDLAIPGGTLIAAVTTRELCDAVCSNSRNCQGYDWYDVRDECHVHTLLTECTALENRPGWTHYRLKANCQPVEETCFNQVFQDFESHARTGGVLILSGEDFEDCKSLCRVTTECQSVTWFREGQRCYMHSTTGLPQSDACCQHSRKLCDDPTAPAGPTTRPTTPAVATPSTAAPVLPTTPPVTIDTGKCPAQLQGLEDTRSLGGLELIGVNDTEACRQWCQDNDTCAAADFNLVTQDPIKCSWHPVSTFDPTFTEVDDCCIQYRKLTDCEPARCWVMEQGPITDDLGGEYPPIDELLAVSANTSDTFPDVTLEPCAGLCVVEAAYSIDASSGAFSTAGPGEAARYCDTSVAEEDLERLGRSCQMEVLSEDDAVKNVSIVCYCRTDACNSFWAQALQSLIAHYPLDCSTEDRAFSGRHGVATDLEYSATDQAKNWSAVFTGQNYIEVPAFTNVLLGQIGPSPNYFITPNFTLFFWFKFTDILGDTMTLVSNGPRGESSLDVYTDFLNRTHRRIHATIKIQGNEYTGSVAAPYDEWRYLALRVVGSEVTGTLELIVSTGDAEEEYDFDVIDTGIADTETGLKLDPTGNRLALGKQQSALPLLGGQADVDAQYYTGLLDEVWLLARGLSDLELTVLSEASYFPTRLQD